jgi:hypothetical protein
MGNYAAVDNSGEIPSDIEVLLDVSPGKVYRAQPQEVFSLSRKLFARAGAKALRDHGGGTTSAAANDTG